MAHVHDLVQRIDLVLGEGERSRLSRWRPPSGTCARRLTASSRTPAARASAAMKTVLVCSVQTPFIVGGAEILVADLRQHLERRGFASTSSTCPSSGTRSRSSSVRRWHGGCSTSPRATARPSIWSSRPSSRASSSRHPRKVTWLFHQHREAYDLYGTAYCSFETPRSTDQIRDAIRHDGHARAGRVPRRSSRSRRTWPIASQHYNGLAAEALYPPPKHLGRYRNDGYGDYLFFAGRLDRLKRLDLAVDAIRPRCARARA